MARFTSGLRGPAAGLALLLFLGTPASAARVKPSNPDRGAAGIAPARAARTAAPHGARGAADVLVVRTGLEYPTLQAALDDPATQAGDTLVVQAASHAESPVVVDKQVTIRGGTGGATLLPQSDTGTSGDAKGWFVVNADAVAFRDLSFDGTGFRIYQGLRIKGAGPNVVERCSFAHLGYNPSSDYAGFAVVDFQGGLTVRDCSFSDIGRDGVFLTGLAPSLLENVTYTGKGPGDWLDYGVELGLGGVGTLHACTVTGCVGVATVDGSVSAAVIATDYFGPGTSATLRNCLLNANTAAVGAGYTDVDHPVDATVVAVTGSDLSGNASGAISSVVSGTLDASGNWWGSASESGVAAQVSGNPVDWTPWLESGADTGPAPGFQGDFGGLEVSAASPQSGPADRLAEALGLLTGTTLDLAAGTYHESLTLATAGLTLRGAQHGVPACTRGGAESVIDGGADPDGTIRVSADNVTLDGLKIVNSTYAVYATAPCSGLDVLNTVIDGATADGIIFYKAATGTARANRISNCGATGISGGDEDGHPTATLIEDNCIEQVRYGISGYQSGSVIRRNTVTAFAGAPPAAGISGQLVGTSVSANRVSGYLQAPGVALTAYPGRPNSASVTFSGNTITGNAAGFYFDAGATLVGVKANGNDITANAPAGGVVNLSPAAFEATCNWWGDVLGPNVPPVNPSPANGVSGVVTYAPWLGGSIAGSPACDRYGADYVSANGTGLCVSSAHACVGVPVEFTRADTARARGISVTFRLGGGLALCGPPAASVHQGLWLGGYPTTFQVLDNGDGSYTVDQAILGEPCGVGEPGTPFAIDVTRAPGSTDTSGTITVTDVQVRNCRNQPLPGIPGPVGVIRIDFTAPDSISGLAAVQKKSGNDTDGTTKITLSWPAPAEAGSPVFVYRAGFGQYPEYDDGGGAEPARPAAFPPPAPWTYVGVSYGTGLMDEPPARDFWYYVAFVRDGCGNVSRASNRTPGTLDYFLGDVSNGSAPGTGNNRVSTEDISLLGAHYGATLALNGAFNYLDVGPTTDYSVNARPTTDNRVNFEDLMVMSVNHGVVGKPGVRLAAAVADRLALEVVNGPAVGDVVTARLRFSGTGRVQGVSTHLAWNAAVVTPVGTAPGELLDQQGGVALCAEPGSVDAALQGGGHALTGEGVLASVLFRRVAAGDPGIALASVDARDTANGKVDLSTGATPAPAAPPVATGLRPVAPNPFRGSATLEFSLAAAGRVELCVYSVDGRLVRTLLDGERAVGVHRESWDGRDRGGAAVPPGVYFARLRAAGGSYTRTVTLLK